MEPNYPSYSIEELYSARDTIDRIAFPDRYNLILEHIDKRRVEGEMSDEDAMLLELTHNLDPNFRLIMMSRLGAVAALVFSVLIFFHFGKSIGSNLLIGLAMLGAFLALTFFCFMKSRIAFSILILTYITSGLPQFDVRPESANSGLGTIAFLLLCMGAVATFIYHHRTRQESSGLSEEQE